MKSLPLFLCDENVFVSVPQRSCAVAETSKQSKSLPVSVDIPEEFLDGLTFEMMSVPMVLPSGKVVDQRTLERHQDSEANWGRPPSDPFTGRPFTATLHPILDTALKSRIDHFLVVHQDKQELHFVPRTVGHRDIYTARKQTNHSPSLKNNLNNQSYQKSSLNSNTSSVQKASHTEITSGSRKRTPNPELTIISETVVQNKNKKVKSNMTVLASKSDLSHLQKDDDLDDALKAVLHGLPSYLNMEKNPQSTPDICCCRCKSNNNLFKLPCNHVICRVCLLMKTKSAQPSCDICQKIFTSNQPVKYHPV